MAHFDGKYQIRDFNLDNFSFECSFIQSIHFVIENTVLGVVAWLNIVIKLYFSLNLLNKTIKNQNIPMKNAAQFQISILELS